MTVPVTPRLKATASWAGLGEKLAPLIVMVGLMSGRLLGLVGVRGGRVGVFGVVRGGGKKSKWTGLGVGGVARGAGEVKSPPPFPRGGNRRDLRARYDREACGAGAAETHRRGADEARS